MTHGRESSPRVCILRHASVPADPRVRKHIETLIGDGWSVDVICLREPGEASRERWGGATIYRAPVRHKRKNLIRYAFEYGAFLLIAGVLLAWLDLRRNYDVVQVYNMPDPLLFAALPARLRGARVVWYMLELTPDLAGEALGLPAGHVLIRALRTFEKLCVRTADRVICVSEFQRKVVSGRSLPPGKQLDVVLNVPDAAQFRPAAAPKGVNARFRLFTHGSILKRYGIDTAIRALPRLREIIEGLELQILGRGEHRAELEALGMRLGVAALISFLEPVPYESVPSFIGRADVCLLLTGNPWLSPNKLFEYAAMRKPVIAARSEFLPTVFPDDALVTFEAGDVESFSAAVLEVHGDRTASLARAARAYESFLAHRWEVERTIYLDILQGLLGTHGRSPGGGEEVRAADRPPRPGSSREILD